MARGETNLELSYMGPKFWDLIPKEMRQVTTLKELKAKIKIPADTVELTFFRGGSLDNAF